MNIVYRNVNLNDAHEMQIVAKIDTTIPALFDPLFLVNEQSIADRLEQLMKCKTDDFFEVATVNEKIIGFHFMNRFKSMHGLMAANIQTLWVDPEFRKQGIGTKLKERGEMWARENKLDHIATFVHGKNSPMQALNKNLDYELVGYKLRKNLAKS